MQGIVWTLVSRVMSRPWGRQRGKGIFGQPAGAGSSQVLSRRKIFKRAAGVAVAGAAGGSVLTGVIASPARAAAGRPRSRRPRPWSRARWRPLSSYSPMPATIAVDASQGNDFRVTIAGSRTLGNPANPTDGQKIVFHVTQGSGGSFTLSYGSGYEFSTGLPQPTLSTTAGDTDLLAFVYNAPERQVAAGRVRGRVQPRRSSPRRRAPSGLFPSTNGPSSPVSYGGPFLAGVLFEVTAGGIWFDGYWWWVCPSGQSTAAQQFALWAVYNGGSGAALVPGSAVTSGTLAAGQWNYVPLSTPIPLAIGACYNACTGFSGGFPDTDGQFGSGGAYSAGIVNGPLSGFSRPVRVAAGAFRHVSGSVQRRGDGPHGGHAGQRVELR